MGVVQRTGMDIPEHWESVNTKSLKGLIMVLGAPDMGKSTFCEYLVQRLAKEHRHVALMDGDPGQSRLGPPTTLNLSLNSGVRRVFVGSTSPVRHMLPMMVAASKLVHEAKSAGAEAIVYDTTGLIDEHQGGVTFKQAKIDLLQPNVILALQRGKELEPILAPFGKRGGLQIIDVKPSLAVQPRNMYMRRRYRRLKFTKYFTDPQRVTLDWSKFAVFPKPYFTKHVLVGLEDIEGFTVALGIALDIRPQERTVTLLLPKISLDEVKVLRVGDILVDPMSFEDRKIL